MTVLINLFSWSDGTQFVQRICHCIKISLSSTTVKKRKTSLYLRWSHLYILMVDMLLAKPDFCPKKVIKHGNTIERQRP